MGVKKGRREGRWKAMDAEIQVSSNASVLLSVLHVYTERWHTVLTCV